MLLCIISVTLFVNIIISRIFSQVCAHPVCPGVIAVCGEGRLLVLELDSEGEVQQRRELLAPLIPNEYTLGWLPGAGWHNRVAITTATQVTILSTHGDVNLPSFTVHDVIVASTFSDTELFILTRSGQILNSLLFDDVALNFELDSSLQVAFSVVLSRRSMSHTVCGDMAQPEFPQKTKDSF